MRKNLHEPVNSERRGNGSESCKNSYSNRKRVEQQMKKRLIILSSDIPVSQNVPESGMLRSSSPASSQL